MARKRSKQRIKVDRVANLVDVWWGDERATCTMNELRERNTMLPDAIEREVLDRLRALVVKKYKLTAAMQGMLKSLQQDGSTTPHAPTARGRIMKALMDRELIEFAPVGVKLTLEGELVAKELRNES